MNRHMQGHGEMANIRAHFESEFLSDLLMKLRVFIERDELNLMVAEVVIYYSDGIWQADIRNYLQNEQK